jgi:DNA invertase Pin-like site-specific DNA recombinase
MLADLAGGDRDAVIVYNLDRLHRDTDTDTDADAHADAVAILVAAELLAMLCCLAPQFS